MVWTRPCGGRPLLADREWQSRAKWADKLHTKHWGLAPPARKASAFERGESYVRFPKPPPNGITGGERRGARHVDRRWSVWPQLKHRAEVEEERIGGCADSACRGNGARKVRSIGSSYGSTRLVAQTPWPRWASLKNARLLHRTFQGGHMLGAQ